MDEQLSRRLGDVEAVLEELIDRRERLLVELLGVLALEDLPDEHLAERDGQLIDEPSDPQLVVSDDGPVFKEDPADVKRHLGFLIGAAHFLDLTDDRAVRYAHADDPHLAQMRVDRVGRLLDISVPASVRQVLDHHDIVLVDRGDKIHRRCPDELLDDLEHAPVALRARLNDHDDSLRIDGNVQFLGPAVDIHEKKVVKDQVLHEAVLVIALLKSAHQPLELECGHPADEERAVRFTVDHKNVFELLLVHHLEELVRSR